LTTCWSPLLYLTCPTCVRVDPLCFPLVRVVNTRFFLRESFLNIFFLRAVLCPFPVGVLSFPTIDRFKGRSRYRTHPKVTCFPALGCCFFLKVDSDFVFHRIGRLRGLLWVDRDDFLEFLCCLVKPSIVFHVRFGKSFFLFVLFFFNAHGSGVSLASGVFQFCFFSFSPA